MQPSDFIRFLEEVPSPFHFAEIAKTELLKLGYSELKEINSHNSPPQKGFFIRGGSLIAFDIGGKESAIIGISHSDSSGFRLQNSSEPETDQLILKLNKAGLIRNKSFFGRDLRMSGIVYYRKDNETSNISSCLYDSKIPIAFIPYVEEKEDAQNPTAVSFISEPISSHLAKQCECETNRLCGHELHLIDAQPAVLLGDLITSGRISNIGTSYSHLEAFINSPTPKSSTKILVVFNNVETSIQFGSSSSNSNFLETVLNFIFGQSQNNNYKYKSLIVTSQCKSAYNVSSPDKTTTKNPIQVGSGAIIKMSGRSTFGTEAEGEGTIKLAANESNATLQVFLPRNDFLSNPSLSRNLSVSLGIKSVDIGFPVIHIKKARETASWNDIISEYNIMKTLFTNYEQLRSSVH